MPMKLLLVEDSLSIQTIVETTFTRAGFEVMVVGDALDGLHKAQTLRPDIVLADASMPGLDGFQLCQRIRQSAGGRHLPVVLLTSGFAAYDKVKGDHAGVTMHLAKPFEPQALLDMVKQLVPGTPSPTFPAVSPPAAESSQRAGAAADRAAPREPQDADPHGSRETVALDALYQTLGRHMLQMLHDALDAHLTATLAHLMPHLLDTVRDVVQAKMPDLLEVLLQQEIDKLKQAVERDQHET